MQRMWSNFRSATGVSSSLILAFTLGGCLDQGPVASMDPPPAVIPTTALQVLECEGSLDGTLTCGTPEGHSEGPAQVVVGGQNTYVRLASSGVAYDPGTEVFAFDVTVRNLLREAIGTPDGASPDPDGVRVFFADGPTATGGEGTITVLNADGTGTFTGSDQPFFAYGEILEQNEESAPRNWQLDIPSTVSTFSFTVFVETDVQSLLVINEVMVDPGHDILEADGQWFEIYNAGTLAVNLQNMVIADSAVSGRGPYHVITQSVAIPGGTFAVLGASSDTNQNGGVPVDYAYGSALELEAASDAIKIARVVGPDTLTIDRVSWTDGSIAALEAFSRELLSPDLDNSAVDGLNWVNGSEIYGEGGFGTPGAVNTGVASVGCVSLAVGEALTTTLGAAAESCFTGTTLQEYTFMPVNPSTSELALTVVGTGIQAVTGPPNPAPGIEGGSNVFGGAFDGHLTPIGAAANTTLPPAAGAARGMANLVAMGSGVQRAIEPGVPALGDLWDLNVGPGCTGTPDLRTGRVVGVGTHVIVVADTLNPADGFDPAQYNALALEADSIAYPAVTENFGTPSDIDGNGRIVLFFTRAINELTPPGTGTLVSGLFLARDLSAPTIEGCPQSNVGEMIYLMVPDPSGEINGNSRSVAEVGLATLPTVGSELQRLVNASRRLHVNGGGELEEVWLDRGLSAIARELMFYRATDGFAPGQNIGSETFDGPGGEERIEAVSRFLFPDLFGYYIWTQPPETMGVFGTEETQVEQGALWAFLRYAADRRGGSQADFWASLVDSNLTGKANLANAFGADPDEWLRDFVAATYADDAVAGVDPTYTHPSWNFRSLFIDPPFPAVRPLTEGVEQSLTLSSGGSAAFFRFGVAAQGQGVITLTSGGLPVVSTHPLIVLRTR